MLPQAEERPQGWVNDLVETLGNAKLEEFHKEAIYKLAPEWDAPPAQLVATATLL